MTPEEIEQALKTCAEMRRQVKREYDRFIRLAVNTGFTNTKIASLVGVTETAIRNYRKRNRI